MTDVLLDRARLRDARDTLQNATDTFNSAAQTNNALEEAIANPHGKDSLRDRVGWFEANWSGNREELTEMIEGVLDALTSIVDAWDTWEADAVASMEGSG